MITITLTNGATWMRKWCPLSYKIINTKDGDYIEMEFEDNKIAIIPRRMAMVEETKED